MGNSCCNDKENTEVLLKTITGDDESDSKKRGSYQPPKRVSTDEGDPGRQIEGKTQVEGQTRSFSGRRQQRQSRLISPNETESWTDKGSSKDEKRKKKAWKKKQRERLKKLVSECNELHDSAGLVEGDFQHDKIVVKIFRRKIGAIGYTEADIRGVEQHLEMLKNKDAYVDYMIKQCTRLHEELNVTYESIPHSWGEKARKVVHDIFANKTADLEEEDVERYFKHLKEQARKQKVREIVLRCNEYHKELQYTSDRYEGTAIVQAIFEEDFDFFAQEHLRQLEIHLEKLKHKMWSRKRKQQKRHYRYQLKDICKECNERHNELGLVIDDYKGNDLVCHIFKEVYYKIGYSKEGVDAAKAYLHSLNQVTPPVRFKLILKACIRLHHELDLTGEDFEEEEPSQLAAIKAMFNGTATMEEHGNEIAQHFHKLQRIHRTRRLEVLLRECNQIHQKLGHKPANFPGDPLIQKILSNDVTQFEPIDSLTIKAVEKHLEDLKDNNGEVIGEIEKETVEQVQDSVEECMILHKSLGLTTEDYEDDKVVKMIFLGDVREIISSGNVEAVEIHLQNLQIMYEKQQKDMFDPPPERKEEIVNIFNSYSKDGSGNVDAAQLNKIMRQVLQTQLSEEVMQSLRGKNAGVKLPKFRDDLGAVGLDEFMPVLDDFLQRIRSHVDDMAEHARKQREELNRNALSDEQKLQQEFARSAQLLRQTQKIEQIEETLNKYVVKKDSKKG